MGRIDESDPNLYRVCWRYKDNRLGGSGHGEPIPYEHAVIVCNRANERHPGILHEIYPAYLACVRAAKRGSIPNRTLQFYPVNFIVKE